MGTRHILTQGKRVGRRQAIERPRMCFCPPLPAEVTIFVRCVLIIWQHHADDDGTRAKLQKRPFLTVGERLFAFQNPNFTPPPPGPLCYV